MGMGYALALIVTIVALAVPLWIGGWIFDYVTTAGRRSPRGRLRPAPAAGGGRSRLTFSAPQPLDHPLPRTVGAVGIFRASDNCQVDRCTGPDHAGRCPRTSSDGTVPCAGQLLGLPVPVRGSQAWHIPAGYSACPLGGYGAYRSAT